MKKFTSDKMRWGLYPHFEGKIEARTKKRRRLKAEIDILLR